MRCNSQVGDGMWRERVFLHVNQCCSVTSVTTRACKKHIPLPKQNCEKNDLCSFTYLLWDALFMESSGTSLDTDSGKWVWAFPMSINNAAKLKVFKFLDRHYSDADYFQTSVLFLSTVSSLAKFHEYLITSLYMKLLTDKQTPDRQMLGTA